MENCKIFYKFRNGDCLVVPRDGFLVNGKCIDVCKEDGINIDHNPYHDKRGRFTTKSGNATGGAGEQGNRNKSKLIEMIKNKAVPLFGMPKLAKEMGMSNEEYAELKRQHYPKKQGNSKKESVKEPSGVKKPSDELLAKIKATAQKQRELVAQRIDKIKKGCWVSEEKAKEYSDVLDDWTASAYEGIRTVQNGFRKSFDGMVYSEAQLAKFAKQSEIIEDFISRAPKYKGEMFRGIALDHQPIKKGQVINMAGTSSWSTDEAVAKSFANSRLNKEHCVIFKTIGVSKGTEIDPFVDFGEKEVLVSKEVKFKVVNVRTEKTSVGVVSRTMTFVDLKEV